MEWKYQADPKWLHARHRILTATNFENLKASLAKASEAALKGDKLIPAFTAAWMQKHGDETRLEEDLWSYGVQARGHCLEPYAVELYSGYTGKDYCHWDDVVVCNKTIGFSPDAVLDMPCPKPGSYPLDKFEAKEILEIKSYSLENHGKAFATAPTGMKERFQIAWQMFCAPSIEAGHLLFYNPEAPVPLLPITYTRDDLKKEIMMASEVLRLYKCTDEVMSNATNGNLAKYCQENGKAELQIWLEVNSE